MNKDSIIKTLLIILNFLAGLVLVRFTVSKFAAWPISVAGFVDMAKPLGIDPTTFRLTAGFIIGYTALAFFINILIIFFKKENNRKYILLLTFNILYAIGAMVGALLTEFYLRSSVKWLLVYIAVGVIVIAIMNFFTYYDSITNALKKLRNNKN